MNRPIDRVGRVALATTLLASTAFVTVRPYLNDMLNERFSSVTTIVPRGQAAVVDDVKWKLDSMRVYSHLVNKDKEAIDTEAPAGSVIVAAIITVEATPNKAVDDGFTCEAELQDDRGDKWKEQQVFDVTLPTYCSSDDFPMKRGVPSKVMKIFFVPKSAVPHLLGVVTPPADTRVDRQDRVRLLLKP